MMLAVSSSPPKGHLILAEGVKPGLWILIWLTPDPSYVSGFWFWLVPGAVKTMPRFLFFLLSHSDRGEKDHSHSRNGSVSSRCMSFKKSTVSGAPRQVCNRMAVTLVGLILSHPCSVILCRFIAHSGLFFFFYNLHEHLPSRHLFNISYFSFLNQKNDI